MKSGKAAIASQHERKPRGDGGPAFLPAGLKVAETPAAPLAGAIGATIIALFCLALACLDHLDETQAAVWLRRAAGQGFAGAQFSLGVMYEHGDGALNAVEAAIVRDRNAEQDKGAPKNKLVKLAAATLSDPRDQAPPAAAPQRTRDQPTMPDHEPSTLRDVKVFLGAVGLVALAMPGIPEGLLHALSLVLGAARSSKRPEKLSRPLNDAPGATSTMHRSTRQSAKNVVAFPREPQRRDKEELAFLPAALEIVETPPSPIGRAIGVTIIAIFCLALGWACFGEIDIVASAAGRIVPSGRTKVVQPFETGVVSAIRVRDGQRVKAGDVLVELDPTMNEAERNHLQSDLIMAKLDVARLQAALTEEGDPMAKFNPPAQASPALIATHRQFLIEQTVEQRAKLAALDRQRAQKEAERATIAATIGKLEATLPILQQRVDIRQTLYDHNTGSKANYLEILQALVDEKHDLEVQKSRQREAEAALAAIMETRAQTAAEYRRTRHGELVEAERKAMGLSEDLVKAEQRTRLQLLTAPVDGTVQQLAVHTVGGVVTPAQALLVVVPAESHLEIEAMVSNRDIGFVHPGQDVQIKVDTFNFTRYGLLHGQVLNVSQDAISRDKPQDRSNDGVLGAQASTSEPKGQELNYAARVSLDRSQMQVEDRLVNLSPGMAVTVEFKTGSRRVMTYLLSPLLRYKQESLRER